MLTCKCDVCTSENMKDRRLRSSVLVEHNKNLVIIDAGPDFRTQLLRHQPSHIDAIFFTHEHRDHVAGLDDVRPYFFKTHEPFKLYGNQSVEKALKRDFHYAFGEVNYPGAPRFSYQCIKEYESINIGEMNIEALPVKHGKLDIYGYRFNKELVYITDASFLTNTLIEKITGVKTLIINALRIEKHHSHFTLAQALEIIEKIKPERSYLTHISHLLGKHDEISKTLPQNVELAFDNLTIEI